MNDNSRLTTFPANLAEATEKKKEVLPSNRVKSRKKGVIAYPENPFWQPVEVEIGRKKVTINSGFVAKNDTGEITHTAGLHRIEEVDEDQFIKLYTKNLNVFFDLSLASQKLLQCVLKIVQANPRCVGIHLEWLDMEDYATSIGFKYSRTTYHRALHEMLEKGFLAESERISYFWINPHLFFNGDRMVLVTEYRKKHRPDAKPTAEKLQNDADLRAQLERNGQLRLDDEHGACGAPDGPAGT
jgi:hypothetical protein